MLPEQTRSCTVQADAQNKSLRKIALLLLLHTLAVLSRITIVEAQTLELTPSYNAIGVKVTNIGLADSCRVEYKYLSKNHWYLAYHPDRISINNIAQFRGSIFLLEENTSYQVRVTVFNGLNATELPVAETKTLSSPQFSPSGNVKWVSPSGTGNYTPENPGNLSALFSSGQVSCGTTIVFTDGIYAVNNLQITINSNCTENTPILLMAAPGASPIIEGGATITTFWAQNANDPNLYSTPLPSGAGHSNICVLGNTALYPYPALTAYALFENYNLRDLNFGYDGFVRNENTIWIKTQAGINPNLHTVNVSKSFRFLTVYGKNRKAFLKVKGLEFRYFGKPVVNSPGSQFDSYSAIVFDLRNVHHVYFDSCQFVHNNSDITFTEECSNITIQNSHFKHDVGKWSHAMIKKSSIYSGSVSSSRGRNVETSAIFLERARSVVIRNNVFDGLNSGVESFVNYGLIEDIDIYNNTFIDNFDAIECDGPWSNLRVLNNEIIRPMAGISAAPPFIGPRYFYRNVIHGMQGRRNEQNDPYFIGCFPVSSNYKGQGVGIKTNPKSSSVPPGNLYFFNNTFHSTDTLGFVFTPWEAEWREAVFINNAYSHSISYPFFYFSLANKAVNGNFQITSIKENYFSYNASAPIVKVKHIHGQYICSDINTVDALQSILRSISGSSNIFIHDPIQEDPLFTSTDIGGFDLDHKSPLIDAGLKIPGFYDYSGMAPDIGAKEYPSTNSINREVTQHLEVAVYPNPFEGIVNIQLAYSMSAVNLSVFDCLGREVHRVQSLSGERFEMNLYHQPDGFYFVRVDAGGAQVLRKILKVRL